MAKSDPGRAPKASTTDIAQAVRTLGLSIERWRAAFARLHHLAENDSIVMSMLHASEAGLRPRDLSEPMGITTGTLTTMLDRLETHGFIARLPNPDDRRSSIVSLTEAGRVAMNDSFANFARALESRIPPADRRQILTLLTDLSGLVDDVFLTMAGEATERPPAVAAAVNRTRAAST